MFQRYKNPKYTGSNRCIPCTIGNLIISVGISAALGVLSPLVGLLFFTGSSGVIYIHGYLIPGTPTLTKRYFPKQVLQLFGKEPEVPQGLAEDTNKEDTEVIVPSENSDNKTIEPESFLLDQNILEATTEGTDLQLVPEFREAWHNEINSLQGKSLTSEDLAPALGIDSNDEVRLNEQERTYALFVNDKPVGKWPSYTALLADIAANQLLTEQINNWKQYSISQQGIVLRGLRIFLERCPGSDGQVSLSQKTVESCCSSQQVVAATCEETGERLLEYPV